MRCAASPARPLSAPQLDTAAAFRARDRHLGAAAHSCRLSTLQTCGKDPQVRRPACGLGCSSARRGLTSASPARRGLAVQSTRADSPRPPFLARLSVRVLVPQPLIAARRMYSYRRASVLRHLYHARLRCGCIARRPCAGDGVSSALVVFFDHSRMSGSPHTTHACGRTCCA